MNDIGRSGYSSPSALDRFRSRVLADGSLQQKLWACENTDRFVDLVVEIARGGGLELTASSVQAAMQSNLPGAEPLFAAEPSDTAPPAGWLPVRASWRGRQLCAEWQYFADQRLRDPFFEGDVRRAFRRPFNRLFRLVTPIAAAGERSRVLPGLRPTGFIFHMSRCGSTLVEQMLAALDRNIAISEASPIDAIVQARHVRPDLPVDEQARWLTWIVDALAAPRAGESRCFIKLDCWHTLALPLFRQAFPEVPWVFLYRDPVEVLVSQLAMPGTQMIPGMMAPDLHGVGQSYDPRRPEDYYARILASVCAPVLRHYSPGRALLINYSQLPEAAWTAILPHFGVPLSEGDRLDMAAAARRDAKAPSFEFAGDTQAKQQAATARVRSAASEWLGEIYGRLEVLRLAHPHPAGIC